MEEEDGEEVEMVAEPVLSPTDGKGELVVVSDKEEGEVRGEDRAEDEEEAMKEKCVEVCHKNRRSSACGTLLSLLSPVVK